MKRQPFCANGSEFADLAFSNIAANVCQCLSAIVSKLSTRDTSRQGLLIKHIQELAKTSHRLVGSKRFTLVGGGLATIDRLPTVSLVLEQL